MTNRNFTGGTVLKDSANIFDYETGTEYLQALYRAASTANPRFSLRSFALKIDLDQSLLTRYLAKERNLSGEKTEVIAQRLGLDEQETHYFKLLTLLGDKGEVELLKKLRASFLYDRHRTNLKTEECRDLLMGKNLILDMKAHALFEMQSLKSPGMTELLTLLNRYFKVEEREALAIIDTLVRQGLLDCDDNSVRKKEFKNAFLPTEEVPYAEGLRFHTDALNVVKSALEDFDNSDMEVYTSLIPIRKEGRERIHEALQQLHALIFEYKATHDADDLYLVTSAMVNLTARH